MGFFQNTSKDLLRSIIDGYNAFSHVEIEAGEYVWFSKKNICIRRTHDKVLFNKFTKFKKCIS